MKVLPVNGYILVSPVEETPQTERKTSGLIFNDNTKRTTKVYKTTASARIDGGDVPEGAFVFTRSDASALTVVHDGASFIFINTADVIGVTN